MNDLIQYQYRLTTHERMALDKNNNYKTQSIKIKRKSIDYFLLGILDGVILSAILYAFTFNNNISFCIKIFLIPPFIGIIICFLFAIHSMTIHKYITPKIIEMEIEKIKNEKV
jgi:hypothetical protein